MELDGYAALRRLEIQFALNPETTAALLGVSRRTVFRWHAKKQVPRRVALHIDAWLEGSPLSVGLNRTSLKWACRDNLVRDYLVPGWRD